MSTAIAGFLIGAGLFFGLDALGAHIHNGMVAAVRKWKSLKGFADDR